MQKNIASLGFISGQHKVSSWGWNLQPNNLVLLAENLWHNCFLNYFQTCFSWEVCFQQVCLEPVSPFVLWKSQLRKAQLCFSVCSWLLGLKLPPGRAVCLLMEELLKAVPCFQSQFSSLFLTSFLPQFPPLPVTSLWSAGFCFFLRQGGPYMGMVCVTPGWAGHCALAGCCGCQSSRQRSPRVAGTSTSPTAPWWSATSSPRMLAPTRASLPTGGQRPDRFSCRSQVNYLLLRTREVAQGSSLMVTEPRLNKAAAGGNFLCWQEGVWRQQGIFWCYLMIKP